VAPSAHFSEGAEPPFFRAFLSLEKSKLNLCSRRAFTLFLLFLAKADREILIARLIIR